jgi:hypothetical protein
MKPTKISAIWVVPVKSIENEAINRPKAQPMKPKT